MTIFLNFFFLYFLDRSFAYAFQNYSQIKSITTYTTGNTFLVLNGFQTVCDLNCTYFAWDYSLSQIVKFDQKWNFKSQTYYSRPLAMLSVDFNNTKLLYLTYFNGILCFNSDNMNILISYNYYQCNLNAIYYNNLTDHLIFVSGQSYGIIIFSLELEFVSLYSFTNALTTYVTGYNGLLFVSTTNGIIWVLQNETLSYNFQTLCTSITKLKIDQFGYIGVVCSTNKIYIYSTNGAYTGVAWTSPITSTVDIGFDTSGNLVIAATTGIYLFH